MKKKVLIILILVFVLMVIYILGINFHVKYSTKNKITDINEISNTKFDAIVVLGAKVHDDGTISMMLADRLDKTLEVFNYNVSDIILVSGDSENDDYDETILMKRYLLQNKINEKNIKVDIYGLSTYDSIYRAKEIFNYNKILIITQEYHLYRALYIADSLGMNAYGISAEGEGYFGQSMREFREILARNKDFIISKFNFKPKYMN